MTLTNETGMITPDGLFFIAFGKEAPFSGPRLPILLRFFAPMGRAVELPKGFQTRKKRIEARAEPHV